MPVAAIPNNRKQSGEWDVNLKTSNGPRLIEGQSHNERLEAVFVRAPGYINREITLPCRVGSPSYLSSSVTPQLLEEIQSHNRTIIVPNSKGQIPKRCQSSKVVLASPYECGRVLEYDSKVLIDDKLQVLTVKGVGCTDFARRTGGENPWMMPDHRYFTADHANRLSRFPFLDHFGVLAKECAEKQLLGMQELAARGVDCEHILAIFPVLEVADVRGKMISVDMLKESGTIRAEDQPVLMHRALHSNLRLLDAVMLKELNFHSSIPDFAEHALAEYRIFVDKPRASMTSYYAWLANKVVTQELPLIMQGFAMSSGRWQDLGRNISILGQEIDLADMTVRKDLFSNSHYFVTHVEKHFHNLVKVLRVYGDTLSHYGDRKIKASPIEQIVWDAMVKAIRDPSLEKIYNQFQGTSCAHTTIEKFAYDVFQAMAKAFTNYTAMTKSKSFEAAHNALKARLKDKLVYC